MNLVPKYIEGITAYSLQDCYGATLASDPHPCHQPLIDWIDKNTVNDETLPTCPTPWCTKCGVFVAVHTGLRAGYAPLPDATLFD